MNCYLKSNLTLNEMTNCYTCQSSNNDLSVAEMAKNVCDRV